MRTVRVFFSKHGRAKYISHLDLNRCMALAFRRAQVPVWYTQGFNPHAHIVFAQALSLFYESDGEVMDFRLDGEMEDAEIVRRLGEQMPEGIAILRAAAPVLPLRALAAASYRMELTFDACSRQQLEDAVAQLSARRELIFEKTTKRGTRAIDVAEFWRGSQFAAQDGMLTVQTVLPASAEQNLNPSCFTDVLEKYADLTPDFEQVTRTALLDAQGQPFA